LRIDKIFVGLRPEAPKPEGLYFGFVGEDRFDEVTRYFTPPSDQEKFHVIYYDAGVPLPKG
jgi:hypothetical protein